MARNTRPYVIPRINEHGMIRLLFPDQVEIDLRPAEAAEFGIQLLRTYGRTYPARLFLGEGEKNYTSVPFTAERLDIAANSGQLTLHVPGELVYQDHRSRVLRDVRAALGIHP